MSDDLGKKIKQITDLLSQDNMSETLKDLFSAFAGPGGNSEAQPKANDTPAAKEEGTGKGEADSSVEMMRTAKKIMDKLNTNNDPRINLLSAIRPYLNNKRQKKLDSCLRLLQVSSLTRLMEDSGKDGN
ncbi:MAG: hypothetical protein Q8920_02695 [Bacillota bacterium]|nr:hypothetical protein [Bacillota bacterium]